SLKVLEQLYTNETFVNGLRNFTSRFKPRLLEMALREIDINVRIASIQILTIIHKIGMLESEDCDQLSLLIYCDVTRVRKAIAPFIKETLEDDFIRERISKVQTFLATNGGTKRKRVNGSGNAATTAKRDWVAFKISLAVQDLWIELDILHQWQKLADYLSKDHSLINQSRTSKGGGISADTIEECYHLSEQEETVLVLVFVKCLQLILSDNTTKDKKKFLTKYAPDAGRIAEVLRIPILMNLDVYSDLRIHKAYEVLVEDIVKLYLKHTHPVVLSHAATTFQHMRQYKNFASMTETRLGELQEEVIKTFLRECEDKDLLTMDLTSDQVHSLCVALNRIEQLITVVNFIDAVEACDDNNKNVYNCIIRLVRRGLLGNMEEEKVVLFFQCEDISLDVLNDLIEKRDQIVQTLFDVGISYGSQALHNVKIMDVIGTLLRGVRGGWLNISHAAIVICNYGTIGSDLDDVIKKLLLEFKERISSGDDAKLFASVYTSDKSSHKEMDYVVELHRSGIQHICSMITAYQIINDFEAHAVGESSKKRTVNSKRRRRTSDSRRNTKDHLVDSNSENQENNEGNNISPSFGDEDVNNSFNSERSSPNMKRSAPVDDIEITKSPAKKRKSYAKKRSSVEMGDVSNEEKPDNEGSDSDGSYQSLSDVRIT
ncbi:11253_t:CDS:10, partial [Racocetra fulgida]